VALIVEEDLWSQLAPHREELRFLRHALVVRRGTAEGNAALGGGDFSALLSQASASLTAAPTSRDDTARWLYSSGSTRFPKGCVHLQHDMYCCVEQYAKPVLNIGPDDVTFSAAKLYFAYGLGNGLYFPLAVGASAFHFPGRVTPDAAYQIISERRPTIFFGVPTLYAAMLAVSDAEQGYDLSSLRLCVSAGETLPPDPHLRRRARLAVAAPAVLV